MTTLSIAIIIAFIIGYFFIAIEHVTKVNKAAVALLMVVVCWTLFMLNPGRALSREDILSSVWGREYEGELKIVDVNIRRLRIKIEDDATTPTYITTVWGFGYKWGN